MNSNTKYVDQLVFETAALELGIPLDKVRSAFQAQVQFTSRVIGEGNLESVMWPHFGKFRPKIRQMQCHSIAKGEKEIRKNTRKPKG